MDVDINILGCSVTPGQKYILFGPDANITGDHQPRKSATEQP